MNIALLYFPILLAKRKESEKKSITEYYLSPDCHLGKNLIAQ